MTRYYNLTVYHKQDIQEGYKVKYYPCITDGILNVTKAKYEGAYDRGEYEVIQ